MEDVLLTGLSLLRRIQVIRTVLFITCITRSCSFFQVFGLWFVLPAYRKDDDSESYVKSDSASVSYGNPDAETSK